MKTLVPKIAFIILFALVLPFSFAGTVHADLTQPESCVHGKGPGGTTDFQKSLECPPTIGDLQLLILRLFAVISVVVGLVVLGGVVRAGFMFTTSMGNPEKVGAARKALTAAILGFVGVAAAYLLLVLLGTLLLGKGVTFIDSGKLIFDFTQYFQAK